MNAVQIVTIKEKLPLFKGEEKAERIELIQLEENGFDLVSQKDLYQIGDEAIYIQPDFCLSDISLFEGFIKPNGDESKSMLGKVDGLPRRIRAKKFNFHKGDGLPVYSNGILLPYKEVEDYIWSNKLDKDKYFIFSDNVNLDEELNITKWEEPENNSGAGIKGGSSISFPQGVVKTDEENFNNLIHHVEKILPKRLIGKLKIDGSSITLWYKDGKSGIASRNMGKPIYTRRITGRRTKTFIDKLLFWKKVDLNIYEDVLNDSDFVKYGKPYLDRLVNYCEKHKLNLVLQGEICGQGMKGSGNKNNPHSKLPTDIIFFNVCEYEEQSIKLPETDFQAICYNLQLPTVPIIFDKVFDNITELKQECENYFKNNLVEGIVIRDEFHNFSTKYISQEYDSKK
jgi:RNA ligase (TIGR02306 family)